VVYMVQCLSLLILLIESCHVSACWLSGSYMTNRICVFIWKIQLDIKSFYYVFDRD
jgi:hypothetical protein